MKESSRAIGAGLVWLIAGAIVAGSFQALWAQIAGGPEGLVRAGRLEPAHVIVEENLPGVPVSDGLGHDGQIFFAIGTDVTASTLDPSLVPPYRYRRVLYPAVASLFGILEGNALLWGMIVTASLSVGVAAAAVADVRTSYRMSWLAPLALVLNPGLWLSAMYLTADALAAALGFLGVALFIRRQDRWAWLALLGAGLTKETHLVFAVGLAAFALYRREPQRAARILAYPALGYAVWLTFVALRLGNPFESEGNLALPFQGLLQSASQWGEHSSAELFLTGLTLLAVAAGLISAWKRRNMFDWVAIPWVLLALTAAYRVWDIGNNSIRTLAPLLTLVILGSLRIRSPADLLEG